MRYDDPMRTTVTLDDDVLKLVDQYRESHRIGQSQAINQLLRQIVPSAYTPRFVQRTSPGYARMNVENIGEVLTFLDEAPA
jgi:metal-responsive CopG/Arc/MetJ family transcriptional regulator